MSDKSKTIINYVSSAIVNVKHQCLSSAAAAFVLKIQNADKVVINGLSSNNQANATTNCKEADDVDVRSIYGNLSDILNTAIQASPSQANIKKTFIATLTSAIDINVVTTCFSNALAAVELDISNVPKGGTVTFDNVKVQNRATAAINSCIQTVAVHVGGKDMTMQDYIEANVGWMTSVTGTRSQTSVQEQGQEQQQQAAKIPPPPVGNVFRCPAATDRMYDTDLIVVWVLIVLCGLVAVGRIVWTKTF